MSRTLGIAADHGGYHLKESIKAWLEAQGHTVRDYGAAAYDAQDDYPDFVAPLARGVAAGEVERGVAICGSGVGATMVANRVANARACLITDTYSARQGVEHDALNVLCLGERITGVELVREILRAYLAAEYSGEARHERRLAKMRALEKG